MYLNKDQRKFLGFLICVILIGALFRQTNIVAFLATTHDRMGQKPIIPDVYNYDTVKMEELLVIPGIDSTAAEHFLKIRSGRQIYSFIDLERKGTLSKKHLEILSNSIYFPKGPSLFRPLNINTAKAHDFTYLDGIGPKLASRIIKYRNANGFFKSLDELKHVKGIGDKIFIVNKEKLSLTD